jgi:hypothetical protein
MAVRDAIQRAAIAHRYYGYRRIAAQLQQQGFMVSAKKVRSGVVTNHVTCLTSSDIPDVGWVPHLAIQYFVAHFDDTSKAQYWPQIGHLSDAS